MHSAPSASLLLPVSSVPAVAHGWSCADARAGCTGGSYTPHALPASERISNPEQPTFGKVCTYRDGNAATARQVLHHPISPAGWTRRNLQWFNWWSLRCSISKLEQQLPGAVSSSTRSPPQTVLASDRVCTLSPCPPQHPELKTPHQQWGTERYCLGKELEPWAPASDLSLDVWQPQVIAQQLLNAYIHRGLPTRSFSLNLG